VLHGQMDKTGQPMRTDNLCH